MKMMIAAVTLLASSAFATTHISYPKYDGVSVADLCDAGSVYKTTRAIKVCDQYEVTESPADDLYQGNSATCVAFHKEWLTVSKTFNTCLSYHTGDVLAGTCAEYGTGVRTNRYIAEKNYNGEVSQVEYFYGEIPACDGGATPSPTPSPAPSPTPSPSPSPQPVN